VEHVVGQVKTSQMSGYTAMGRAIMDGRGRRVYKLVIYVGVEEGYEEYIVEGTPSILVKTSEILGTEKQHTLLLT